MLHITWLRTAVQDPGLLRRAFDDVLRPSFEPDELPSWDFLIAGFAQPAQQGVAVAYEESPDGERLALGAAVTNWREGGHVGTLSYLAVAATSRGTGVGARLLDEHAKWWPTLGLSTVLGEVHDPRRHAATDRERPVDRLRFYARAGARLVGVPWVQPALSRVTERSRGMLLIALRPVAPSIPARDLVEWAVEYYAEAEQPSGTDDEFRTLLERFHERERWIPRDVMAFETVEPLNP